MKYRKKPVIIEAFKLGFDPFPKWFTDVYRDGPTIYYETGCIQIKTLEGVMEARYGNYIIKGVMGEFYPCKSYIFEKTYEKVEE